MTPDINFDSLLYNPFSIHESSINSEDDPDSKFYQDISFLETHYCSPNDCQNNFQCFLKDSISVLHLNIRSIKRNLNLSKNFIQQLTSNLALFVFQKHG